MLCTLACIPCGGPMGGVRSHPPCPHSPQPLPSLPAGKAAAMKVWIVLLGATLLAGCQANPLVQDEPKTKWEEAVNVFWNYLSKVGHAADNVTAQIKSSQLSKELDGLITDSMAEVEVYREGLQARFGPYTQAAQQRLGSEVAALTGKLRADMEEAKGRVVQYTGDVRLMFDQNLEEVRARVAMYLRKLRKRLGKDTEELRRKMAAYAGEVQAHTDQQVDAVRQGLQPLIVSIRDKGQQHLEALSQAMGEQSQKVRDSLGTRAQELHGHLQEKAEEVRSSLDQAAEQVRQWFAPFLQDVRAQLQALAEKLQL
ncbi:SWI/SNF-related matrix-associated actin-dependent regulator of chromatin subfamily A-like protein 1 [Platysternon megacephalum]|uniref:SWI/SNF-related matrix-associated actin-dependent regulator of chromatin subfamily A-like protein 1 n=1 Tax=Platysternon megacephalum TaxID=55544 RepID=A0A4D9DJY9_9SAUR|nr:SWI/SNF-related matrix-associated actin-dependent regulator of chromatin subfamily A-like protein 1 [Platysternon megacephalum]